jgi:hypothetical protein
MAVSTSTGTAQSSVRVHLDVDGLAEVVRELRKIQPEFAKEFPKAMKAVANPIIAEARTLLPTPSPLGNWGTWNLARQSGGSRTWTKKAYSGIQAKTNLGAPKGRNRIDLLEIIQRDPAGAIYENAGRNPNPSGDKGEVFLDNLAGKHGNYPANSSRYLWPAVHNNFDLIYSVAQRTIDKFLADFETRVEKI